MRARRLLHAGALAAAVILQVTGAAATPPSNDAIAGAKEISGIPYADTLDTSQATTDADDAALNANCGAPATDASVWYRFTPATDTDLLVDVSQSSYSAGVLVGAGSPGSLSLVTCGPGAVLFTASAGQTYYLLVIDDQFDGGGNGGTLELSVEVPPPPPEVSVTVDPIGRFNRDGTATVSGTVTCSGGDFVDLFGSLRQPVGRFAVLGSFGAFLECAGTQPWTAVVSADNGVFKGGRANLGVEVFSCNIATCAFESAYRQIRLRGK